MSRPAHEPGRRAPVAQIKAPAAELAAARARAANAGLSLSEWTRRLWRSSDEPSEPPPPGDDDYLLPRVEPKPP